MSRQYAKAEELNGEVFRKKAAGETNREKAESYGLQTIVSFYTFSICETYLLNPEYNSNSTILNIELNGLTPNPIRSRPQNSSLFCDEALYHCTALCLIASQAMGVEQTEHRVGRKRAGWRR